MDFHLIVIARPCWAYMYSMSFSVKCKGQVLGITVDTVFYCLLFFCSFYRSKNTLEYKGILVPLLRVLTKVSNVLLFYSSYRAIYVLAQILDNDRNLVHQDGCQLAPAREPRTHSP